MDVGDCPGCGRPAFESHRPGAFICSGCGGRYVGSAALEAIGLSVAEDLTRRTPRRPRTCPECMETMSAIQVGHVVLDRCDGCNSLYFDAGELEQVLSAPELHGGGSTLECDGCRKTTPIGELESRDGKALCRRCIADEPRLRGTGLSAESDFRSAQRHSSEGERDVYSERSGLDWNDGFHDGASIEIGAPLVNALLRLFR